LRIGKEPKPKLNLYVDDLTTLLSIQLKHNALSSNICIIVAVISFHC